MKNKQTMTLFSQRVVSMFLVAALCCLAEDTVAKDAQPAPAGEETDDDPDTCPAPRASQLDPNGYLLFCLCMGRLGNQFEHFLGGLAFAKAINRTLLVPPFRTKKNIPYNDWFKIESLSEYHRVMSAEDFMKQLAPSVWPQQKRVGFCYLPPRAGQKPTDKQDCKMKEGNPFGPFWNGLGVDFVDSESYVMSYFGRNLGKEWRTTYPAEKFPVLAMRGAPAAYPMDPSHWELQRYMVFSDAVAAEGQEYIDDNFPGEKFVGIHLRNGRDWDNACAYVKAKGMDRYMASPQCTHGTGRGVTPQMCLPPKEEILTLLKKIVVQTKAKVVFVATDKYPMKSDIESHLKDHKVHVYHADPWLPLIDQYILAQSDYFIGNCVSSFSSFVKRTRDVTGKPTSFWAFN